MRLIDADWLKNELRSRDFPILNEEDIDNTPTIDAVLVTRCSDCKFWKPKTGWKVAGKCKRNPAMITETFASEFCSRAWRGDDDETD